jgi:hypothetical protein
MEIPQAVKILQLFNEKADKLSCVFRGKPNADIGVSRTEISVDAEYRFRPKANARFGHAEQPFRSMSNTSAR